MKRDFQSDGSVEHEVLNSPVPVAFAAPSGEYWKYQNGTFKQTKKCTKVFYRYFFRFWVGGCNKFPVHKYSAGV